MKRNKGRGVSARDSRPYLAGAVLALALATSLAYFNSFSTGFPLDNQTILLEDPRIQAANASNLGLILQHTYWWPNGESGLYRPLTTLSYLLNYAILGNANHPAGYHWINLLLHAANVLLVFALLLRLMRGRARALPVAFIAAALWAVHPVLTESVTNIVGRADLLGAFSVLAGLLIYLKTAETTGGRRAAWLAALALTTAVGVFSKESAVVLPAVIVLYEAACGRRSRTMLAGCIATLVPIAAMLWQRTVVLSSSPPSEYPFLDNPITAASFWIGRLTAIKVLGRYLALAFWPLHLSADYSYNQIALAHGSLEDWICWVAAVSALALCAMLWFRNRLAFFFAAFAFLNLLPASNLLFPIGTIMAERLLYLPLVGLIAAVVLALEPLRFHRAASVPICIGLIAAAFLLRTWTRNADWTSDLTMAAAGVQTSPRSFKFHRLLASQLLNSDLDRATAEADRAVAILASVPDDLNTAGPWTLAAVCHQARGQYQEAVKLALRSIAIDTATRTAYDRRHGVTSPVPATTAECYRTLASAYRNLNRPSEALGAAAEAQRIDPANTGSYEETASAALAQGKGEEAAIALAEGMFSGGGQNLLDELLKLYQSGVDSQGCAVKAGPHGPTLNPYCEIVHRDLCEATLRIHRQDIRARLGCSN